MDEELFQEACAARERAYAPYSRFQVGAAVKTSAGAIFTGCNIESSSFGLTLCAERMALFKAVSEGHREIESLCLVTATPQPTFPCGACRQVIWELCGDIPITVALQNGEAIELRASQLLPHPFDARSLSGKEPQRSNPGEFPGE